MAPARGGGADRGNPQPPTKATSIQTNMSEAGNVVKLSKKRAAPGPRRSVEAGTDVEIAGLVASDLERAFGKIVRAEGLFWRIGKTHWEAIPDHELRLAVHQYDRAEIAGHRSIVKLGKSRIDSILCEMAAMLTEPRFFADAALGVNCTSGFIRFGHDGTPTLEPHNRDHRCRHTLDAEWTPGARHHDAPPEGTLFHTLLEGCFRGDGDADQKVSMLAETMGAAISGYATKITNPIAVIFHGAAAENGKSQVLDAMMALFPESAKCSVSPAEMSDERHRIALAGKLLNVSAELSSSTAIKSDDFKKVITGDINSARDVYKSRVEFRAMAQNVFAANVLPAFSGGIDNGVRRRLEMLVFGRVIPKNERIARIGARIGEEEMSVLLAFAVAGASRLIRNGAFTVPSSSEAAKREWLSGADPVVAWNDERVEQAPGVKLRSNYVYEQFRAWALDEWFDKRTLPSINGFTQRLKATNPAVRTQRDAAGRFIVGISIRHYDARMTHDRA